MGTEPETKRNGNGATLVGTLKVIALLLTVTVPIMTIQATQISPLTKWKEAHQEVDHIQNDAITRIEDKLDRLAVAEATTAAQVLSLREEVTRLRDELTRHRRNSE